MTNDPAGFRIHVANVGIKDDTLDFCVIASDRPACVAGVFTRSRFAGPSVTLSRDAVRSGTARGVVTVSKNANVANGEVGERDAVELQLRVAERIGASTDEIVVASTGVIGRRYPMERLRSHLDALSWPADATASMADAARAIMTTDTVAKCVSVRVGEATVTGVAKGVGMIEPDMATLLVFIVTDAEVPCDELDAMFRRVVATTFNALSIDTDTSTSDTAVILANGAAGPVAMDELEAAVHGVALELVEQIARDGEGATKMIVCEVTGAADGAQAKRVAKSIVNSPLVKTAVHGADPNWGRIAMAVGKCSDETDIDQGRVRISIGGVQLYPGALTDEELAAVSELLRGDTARIDVDLAIADGRFTAYGCDLTDGYVRLNADYTT